MKNKHMALEDRIEIHQGLSKEMTFKEIVSQIDKDPTTVSKDIKLHAIAYSNSCCKRNHSNCTFVRRKYIAKTAQAEFETTLDESRKGIPMDNEEFYATEQTISEAVKGGKHACHAIQANNHLSVSKTTVYRHIQCGCEISKINFLRAVKLKQRKSQKSVFCWKQNGC